MFDFISKIIPDNDVTALWIVAIVVIGMLFYLVPSMFKHYEYRLKELSDDYKNRDDKRQNEHRQDMKDMLDSFKKEREESNKMLCKQLALFNTRLESIETKIGIV
ncbi:MAG: hypothetical protein LBG58_12100 [Planctomycetaceae bacterium]|jgi:hypothetical protein|nr:hypothetical protein [Planctomycetaceae bacterium]